MPEHKRHERRPHGGGPESSRSHRGRPMTIEEWRSKTVHPPGESESAKKTRLSRLAKEIFERSRFLDHASFDVTSGRPSTVLVPSFADPRDLTNHINSCPKGQAEIWPGKYPASGADVLLTVGTFDKDGYQVQVEQRDTCYPYQHDNVTGVIKDMSDSRLRVWWRKKRQTDDPSLRTTEHSEAYWREHDISTDWRKPRCSTHKFKWEKRAEGKGTVCGNFETHENGGGTADMVWGRDGKWHPAGTEV